MQYADLTDKNGNPLDWWEGDILAVSLGLWHRYLYVIEHDRGCFWAQRVDCKSDRKKLYELADYGILPSVVCNTTETPELLEIKIRERKNE